MFYENNMSFFYLFDLNRVANESGLSKRHYRPVTVIDFLKKNPNHLFIHSSFPTFTANVLSIVNCNLLNRK